MTARELRLLVFALEERFMTEEDRRSWVTRLNGCAKQLEWRMAEYLEEKKENPK